MSMLTMSGAARAIERLNPSEANRAVGESWLSLWSGGKPPTGERFIKSCHSSLVPALAVFEIHERGPIKCVLAGAFYQLALGFNLTGQDILLIAPAADREIRLERMWSVANGAVMSANRNFALLGGGSVSVEEIYLPLFARPDAAARFYLHHSNWRPVGHEWMAGTVKTNLNLAQNPSAISIN